MTTGWYSLEELVEPLLFGSYGNCWTLPWIAFSSAMNSNSIPSLHHPPFGEAKPTAYQECFSREWSQSSLVIIPATPFPSIPYVKRTSLPVSQSPSHCRPSLRCKWLAQHAAQNDVPRNQMGKWMIWNHYTFDQLLRRCWKIQQCPASGVFFPENGFWLYKSS